MSNRSRPYDYPQFVQEKLIIYILGKSNDMHAVQVETRKCFELKYACSECNDDRENNIYRHF